MKPQASVSLTGFTRRPVKHTTRPLMTAALLLFTEKIYVKLITTFVLLVLYNVPIVLVFILLSCAYSRLQAYLSCYTLNKDLFYVHYVHICSSFFPHSHCVMGITWSGRQAFHSYCTCSSCLHLFSFDCLIATDIMICAYHRNLRDPSGFSFLVCSLWLFLLPTQWSTSSNTL